MATVTLISELRFYFFRCTVLAMDWPRVHYLAAVERETRASEAKPASKGIDFVCPSKEWKGLEVCLDGDEILIELD